MAWSPLPGDSPWPALAAQVVLGSAGALAAGRSHARRVAGVVLGFSTLGAAWLAPPGMPLYRGFLALGALLCAIRSIDLARERRSFSVGHRLWMTLAPYDTTKVTRAPPRLDVARLASALGYGLLATLGLWVALGPAKHEAGALAWGLRWGGGALFVYTIVDGTVALVIAGHALFGFVLPPLHRAPILSRSVQEFWGERWNLTVRDWLHRHCFLPLARRRRPVLGLLAAFAGSTLIHVWLVLVAADAALAAMMGAFFMLQGVIVVVEGLLGVARWRPGPAHAWTVLCVLGTSPLFVEPFVRVLEG